MYFTKIAVLALPAVAIGKLSPHPSAMYIADLITAQTTPLELPKDNLEFWCGLCSTSREVIGIPAGAKICPELAAKQLCEKNGCKYILDGIVLLKTC